MMRMRLACKKSQNTLDTSKRLHQNKTRSTGSADKWLDSQFFHYRELQGRHSLEGPGRGWNPYLGVLPTMGLLLLWRPLSKDSAFVWGLFITDRHPDPTKSPFTPITKIFHRYHFPRPLSRRMVFFCPFRKPYSENNKGLQTWWMWWYNMTEPHYYVNLHHFHFKCWSHFFNKNWSIWHR